VRPRVLAHAPGALTQHGYAFAIRERNCLHFRVDASRVPFSLALSFCAKERLRKYG
jgi:hypothetical protein